MTTVSYARFEEHKRKKVPIPRKDKNWLSAAELAERFNVSFPVVKRIFNRFGLSRMEGFMFDMVMGKNWRVQKRKTFEGINLYCLHVKEADHFYQYYGFNIPKAKDWLSVSEVVQHFEMRGPCKIKEKFVRDIFNRFNNKFIRNSQETWKLAERFDMDKGYHVWEDINIVEAVGPDNKPLPDGQLGELIGTNLYNWAMPIIRYRQGDLMALKPKDEQCECGRTFRMLEDFKGRANDIFRARSGREFSPGYLLDVGYVHLIKYGDAMASWQLIQKDADNVEFRCTPTPKMTQEISNSIKTEISKLLGDEFNVRVELVEGLILTPRGKRNQIISNLKRPTNG